MVDNDSWDSWAKKVLSDIERLETKQDALMVKINDICTAIAVLKTKAAVIGGAWGLTAALIVAVVVKYLGGK